MTDHPTTCPACGAGASGNFCGACGSRLGAGFCASCGAELMPGARFCGQCGDQVGGASAARPSEPRTPWIVASILSAGIIIAILLAARARGAAASPDMANAGNQAAAGPTGGTGAMPTGTAPPLDNMTPREQFTRLDDRIMNAAQTGDTTTVIQFWPMAAGAYQNLAETDRDPDIRFRMASLHLLIGQFPQTLALADTILAGAPDNLLAYYLRAIVADFQKDGGAAQAARAAFNQHYEAEMAKNRPEYVANAPMLQGFHTSGAP